MAVPRGRGKYGRPTYSQAQKIVAKFGGEAALAKSLGLSRITIYRWQYSRPYGSDGLIPAPMVPIIEQHARYHGVLLTPRDWQPERINYEPVAEDVIRLPDISTT